MVSVHLLSHALSVKIMENTKLRFEVHTCNCYQNSLEWKLMASWLHNASVCGGGGGGGGGIDYQL